MNRNIRQHAENISEISKNENGFTLHGFPAVGKNFQHRFYISNSSSQEVSYYCEIRNIEMAVDILEVAYNLLNLDFNREKFQNELSKLPFNSEQQRYLIYEKILV